MIYPAQERQTDTSCASGAERAVEGAFLHDYHKPAKSGRKVAHVTLVADSAAELNDRLERFTRVIG